MFIVSPANVLNPGALEARHLPRRFLARAMVWPGRGGGVALWARMVFEVEVLRYAASLLPFVVAALVWRDRALAIAQAPLLMFMAVYMVEMRVLRLPPARRAALIDQAGADRALDLFRSRAKAILTRIVAGRGLAVGALRLVVEQSEMARVAPLTFVSVQAEAGPEVLRLSAEEEHLIRETLFQPPLDERLLHRVNLMENEFLREERLEARAVSAHARLAALMG